MGIVGRGSSWSRGRVYWVCVMELVLRAMSRPNPYSRRGYAGCSGGS